MRSRIKNTTDTVLLNGIPADILAFKFYSVMCYKNCKTWLEISSRRVYSIKTFTDYLDTYIIICEN